MKRIVTLIASGALLLTSCADKQGGEPRQETSAIGFTTSVTRSTPGPVSGFVAGGAFNVWAQMKLTGSTGAPINIFNAEKVTYDGSAWGYTNIRYWERASYDFAAVYPAEVAGASVDFSRGTPVFRITDYNATANYDLMTATTTATYAGGTPDPVAFTFGHLLSRVTIAGRAENGNVTINSIKFTGFGESGNYDSSAGWSGLTEGDGYEASDIVLGGATTDVISEKLMIPQPVAGSGMKVSIQYTPGGAQVQQSAEFDLPVTEFVSSWEPGRSYRYTFVVYGNRIIFDKPTVTAWDDATGGIIVVE